MTRKAILLMGPTATGKTDFAVRLSEQFPCDIISVDSALVYRGMDVGTAKPDADLLARAPHQLIDVRDPEDSYSAGDFVRDATNAMHASFQNGRIPLLVGGTMLYFRSLTQGIADLPAGDDAIRQSIDAEAASHGWPALHRELATVDPAAANRINPNDGQRIQRALEVFRISGVPLTDWQHRSKGEKIDVEFIKVALNIEPRSILHERIESRLTQMIAGGFVDEVQTLMKRPTLTADNPSMRSVGYRQLWNHLRGACSLVEATELALYATRQLAKRQNTWLRSEQQLFQQDSLEVGAADSISSYLASKLS